MITKLLNEENEEQKQKVIVKGVCYEKIVFKKRPTPTFEGVTKRFKELNTESSIFIKTKK